MSLNSIFAEFDWPMAIEISSDRLVNGNFMIFCFDLSVVKCERKHIKSINVTVIANVRHRLRWIVLVGASSALIEILLTSFFFRFVMRYLWCFHLRIITSAAIFYAFWQRFAFKCIKYFDNFVVGFRIWSIPFHLCRLWPGIGAVKTICSFWINLAFFTFHLCNYII